MNDRAPPRLLEDLGRSLERLAEAVQVPAEQPLAIDGTIQRFEFTFELFWKAIRRLLAAQDLEANSPKAVLQHAYRLGWLDDERQWLKVMEDRNLTWHTYREPLALEIYRRIPEHCAAMRAAFDKVRP